MDFNSFGLNDSLLEGVLSMGYKTATPIQTEAIPAVLQGRDLLACAQTGTGKTGAFLIPLMEKLSKKSNHRIRCLVLVPTRELAKQIDEQAEGFSYFSEVSSAAVYGGGSGDIWEQQRRAFETGTDIIIATPGRLIAHMQMEYVKLDEVEYLVLDEADKMLDMGFYEDIVKIVKSLPEKRQTLMFSATMPHKIKELTKKLLNDPVQIALAISKPAEGINQQAYMVFDHQKIKLLEHIFQEKNVENMIIFTSRKVNVQQIVSSLQRLKFKVGGIQSDKTQEERETMMRDFKSGKINVLVATDILSRGIDIEGLSHVVNYDVPGDAEDYVHRIGRTARAQSKGEAITFINEQKQYQFAAIEKLIEKEIPKLPLPEALGAAPEWQPNVKVKDSRPFKKKKFFKKKV